MKKVELIYFPGCPNIERAREALRAGGYSDFIEVDINTLSPEHPHNRFSSPSVLIDDVLVLGSVSGADACSVIDWESLDFHSRSASSCS